MSLKIAFPVISADTGSDVYFRILSENLADYGVDADLISLPYRYEFIPLLNLELKERLSKFDLIHSNIEYGSLFKQNNIPLILTAHHCVFDSYYQRYTSLAQKIYHYCLLNRRMHESLKLANSVICPSKSTFESFVKRYPDHFSKFHMVWNGIDTNFFSMTGSQRKRQVVCVGSPSRRKGFDLLRDLADRLDDIQLIYVGAPTAKQFFHPNIQWLYHISRAELRTLYQQSSALVSLSRLEGFGYTLVEAMACGCSVVCFRNSSLTEIVQGSPVSSMVANENVIEMSLKIKEIVNNKSPDDQVVESVSWVNDNFSLNKYLPEVVNIYKKALEV